MENEKLSDKFAQKYEPLTDSFVVVQNANEEAPKPKREPFSFFKFKARAKVMESEQVQPIENPEQMENISRPPTQTPPPSNQNPSRPAPPFTPPAPPTQRPPMQHNVVTLAKNFYNRLVVLGLLYSEMERLCPQNAQIFEELHSENLILQSTSLLIYQSLSGNNYRPEQNKTTPTLSGNLCQDLIVVQNYLQETIELCLALQRSVNVQNIDRQLIILSTTLLSQKSKLSSLQSNSCN